MGTQYSNINGTLRIQIREADSGAGDAETLKTKRDKNPPKNHGNIPP
jgi:hypothetical protein